MIAVSNPVDRRLCSIPRRRITARWAATAAYEDCVQKPVRAVRFPQQKGRIADLLGGRERVSSGARKRTLNRGAGATCQIWREGRKAVFRRMWDSPASVVFKGPKGCGATLGGRGDWERRQGSVHHLLREINKECWITQQKREGMLDLSRIASDSITTENP